MSIQTYFDQELSVINLGVAHFAQAVRQQGVPAVQVDWKPPVDGRLAARIAAAPRLMKKVYEANEEALRILLAQEVRWVRFTSALEAIEGMQPNMILHAGPPIEWSRMQPVQRQGIISGVLHERLAATREEAEQMILNGQIRVESANDFFCVGVGVGIVTPSMAVAVCQDMHTGKKGYCIPFEGRSGLGAWGVYNDEVEAYLQQIEHVFAPSVDVALQKAGGMDVKSILAKGMQMGDESHTRQTACGLMLISEIVPMLLNADLDHQTVKTCIEMFLSTERWFHPLGLASSMAITRGIKGLAYSSIVTTLCQNGVDTGIKVAGLDEQWFLAPSPTFVGQYFSTQWGPEDAMPFMGDSTVSEVVGMGGFAAAAAPAVMRLRNGGYREAIAQSEEMKLISTGINHNYPIPLLDFKGPGIGIDIFKVIETGITPVCHGGIISKDGGQIGAGAGRFPMEHFIKAAHAFLDRYDA